jgi:hypothetical protein
VHEVLAVNEEVADCEVVESTTAEHTDNSAGDSDCSSDDDKSHISSSSHERHNTEETPADVECEVSIMFTAEDTAAFRELPESECSATRSDLLHATIDTRLPFSFRDDAVLYEKDVIDQDPRAQRGKVHIPVLVVLPLCALSNAYLVRRSAHARENAESQRV